MNNFSEEQIDAVWQKGRVVVGYDDTKCRLDEAGAMIIRDRYGEEDEYGWEVDHVFPKSMLEKMGVPEDMWNIPLNLQPLNAKNNASKKDDYPGYTACCEYDFATGKNKEVMKKLAIASAKAAVLSALFKMK